MKKIHIGLTTLALVLGIISVHASNQKRFAVTYTVNGVGVVGLATLESDCPGNVEVCGHSYENGQELATFKLD